MNAHDYWLKFCAENAGFDKDAKFQTWYFGNSSAMAKELVELVLHGRKTATASLQSVNIVMPENAPLLNGLRVVTTLKGEAQCIIRTTEISLVPFDEVDASFAFDEGEDDQSLDFWRKDHRDYFTREAADLGVELNKRSLICCERFELLYPK